MNDDFGLLGLYVARNLTLDDLGLLGVLGEFILLHKFLIPAFHSIILVRYLRASLSNLCHCFRLSSGSTFVSFLRKTLFCSLIYFIFSRLLVMFNDFGLIFLRIFYGLLDLFEDIILNNRSSRFLFYPSISY